MEVYKAETREVIRRFLNHRLSFSQCIAALNSALAALTPRLTGEQIAPLRALMLSNNEIVMKEMERRGPPTFDPKVLSALGEEIALSAYRSGEVIFAQGDAGESVYYIEKGRVKLTVTSNFGKRAVIGVLSAGSFIGEGSLRGRPHASTATAVSKSAIMRLDKWSVMRLLGKDSAFSELFLAHLLSRNIRLEEDIVYQVLNSNEKRLARVLLLLADFGKKGKPKNLVPKVSFQVLAEMVGTTISRVSFFMRKFRRLGFIDYNGELHINNSLLNVVLRDQFVLMASDPFSVSDPAHPTLGRRVKLKNA